MRKLYSLLLMLFFVIAAHAQIQEPVKFKTELKTLSETEAEIVFNATVDKGWHVYSTDLGSDGPVSATFNVDKKEGVELIGKLTPRGNVVSKYDPMFEMTLRFFEDKASFVQKIKFTAPTYKIEGYLEYGACKLLLRMLKRMMLNLRIQMELRQLLAKALLKSQQHRQVNSR